MLPDSQEKMLDGIFALAKKEADSEGREAHVVELMSRYVKLRPNHADGWTILGDSLRVLGKWREAFVALERGFDLSPDDKKASIASRIGYLLAFHASPVEAKPWYERSTAYPTVESNWTWILRGANLSTIGDLEGAIKCFETAIDLSAKETDEALLNLGLVYRAMGAYDKAAKYFEMALEMRPDYEEAKRALWGLRGMEETLICARKIEGAELH